MYVLNVAAPGAPPGTTGNLWFTRMRRSKPFWRLIFTVAIFKIPGYSDIREINEPLIPVIYVRGSSQGTPWDDREPLVYWNEPLKTVLEVDFYRNSFQNSGIFEYP